MRKVIAIDGPSGAGKSTVAKMVARELGFAYLDTGALYRASALCLLRRGVKEDASDEEIADALRDAVVKFRDGRIFIGAEDVSDQIRTPDAGHYASVFSARRPVRTFLLKTQRDAALTSDLVAEGRDMTTVVFPDAFGKFYLDASVEERTRRRAVELAGKGFPVDEEMIRREVMERDARDSGRDIAPLKKADDACVIDSTGVSVMEVARIILSSLDAGACRGQACNG